MPFVGELAASTSSELPALASALLIPVGSTEQHGPHLPLDTDTRIAAAVARAVVGRLDGLPAGGTQQQWLLAPALSYGASGEHEGFAGTISIGTEALTVLLLEYGRSATGWAPRLVFVNGHGGNVAALNSAVGRLRAEGREVGWCPCAAVGADAHAGHTETSILLHVSPADVRTDQWRAGNGSPLSNLMPAMRRGGVAAVSEVGVLGDPTTATASEGARLFAEMVDGCVRRIGTWAPQRGGMLA